MAEHPTVTAPATDFLLTIVDPSLTERTTQPERTGFVLWGCQNLGRYFTSLEPRPGQRLIIRQLDRARVPLRSFLAELSRFPN